MGRIKGFMARMTEEPKLGPEPGWDNLIEILKTTFGATRTLNYNNGGLFPGILPVLEENNVSNDSSRWYRIINESFTCLGNPENSWKRRQYHASRQKTAVPVAFLHCILDLILTSSACYSIKGVKLASVFTEFQSGIQKKTSLLRTQVPRTYTHNSLKINKIISLKRGKKRKSTFSTSFSFFLYSQ
ncbi:hypothetical protein PCE1_004031 [Barthelona sp. PCE]